MPENVPLQQRRFPRRPKWGVRVELGARRPAQTTAAFGPIAVHRGSTAGRGLQAGRKVTCRMCDAELRLIVWRELGGSFERRSSSLASVCRFCAKYHHGVTHVRPVLGNPVFRPRNTPSSTKNSFGRRHDRGVGSSEPGRKADQRCGTRNFVARQRGRAIQRLPLPAGEGTNARSSGGSRLFWSTFRH